MNSVKAFLVGMMFGAGLTLMYQTARERMKDEDPEGLVEKIEDQLAVLELKARKAAKALAD